MSGAPIPRLVSEWCAPYRSPPVFLLGQIAVYYLYSVAFQNPFYFKKFFGRFRFYTKKTRPLWGGSRRPRHNGRKARYCSTKMDICSEITPTRCWVSYSNGFCFRNMIPCSFDYLIYPYYPAYTMGCYQIVISDDNGRQSILFFLCWLATLMITQKAGKGNHILPSLSTFHGNSRVIPYRKSIWAG